ncbi:A-kinase anchor protein 1, mitochondrial isoform 1-T2 [Discoglossus pictus]
MALRLRTIFPYTLPGVLALIGWWWFFSRKKDQCCKKQERITASAENVEADAQKELIPTEEVIDCSRAQTVQLNQEGSSVPQSCKSCSLSSAELVVSLSESNSDHMSENGKPTVSKPVHENVLHLQASSEYALGVECNSTDNKKLKGQFGLHRGKAENLQEHIALDSSPQLHSINEIGKKVEHNNKQASGNADKGPMFRSKAPCNISKPELDAVPTSKIHTVNEDFDLREACTKNVPTPLEVQICLMENTGTPVLKPTIEEPRTSPDRIKIQESIDKAVGTEDNKIQQCNSTGECSQVENLPTGVLPHEKQITSCEVESDTCDEVETVVKMSVLLQCPQSNDDVPESVIISDLRLGRHSEHCVSQSALENVQLEKVTEHSLKRDTTAFEEEPMEKHNVEFVKSVGFESGRTDVRPSTCVESAYTELLGHELGTDFLKAFSKTLGKSEQFQTSDTLHTSLEEGKTGAILGNYEAKMVEQLAINIISHVIVAAKQEILSGTVTDTLDSSSQVQDVEPGDCLDAKTSISVQHTLHALGQNVAVSNGQSENIHANDTSTQKAQKPSGDVSSEDINSLLENQMEQEEHIPKTSVCNKNKEPDLSPVHCVGGSLDDIHMVIEDSSLSVCTSEDGIGLDDPMQSTELSNVAVSSYDSLSTSGIELSSEQISVSSENDKKNTEAESKDVTYSNGDVKGSSPDVKNEGSWTAETEVDHSGGSDVNSMDSVDSGCSLGKTDQVQNVKQRLEGKKSELVIWEIEVPKHLVGRLIGKQGRFVSFLKESSGAKIYISTLPYTQDFQICHIEGSQQQVDRALSLVGKKFKELNLTNIYAPPPSLALHSLPMTSWLMLPDGVTVEVIVVSVVNAGHMFVQQHTHPTFHALRSLDQQMFLCYSQPGIPTLPSPVEVGVICAAPAVDNAWWRAQVVAYFKESEEVEIRYVDYGGYERVKIEILRQIRSDFVTLPFQGAEVLLDNVIPLENEDHFSSEADSAVNDMTRGTPLLAQVTNYDGATGLPLIQLWSMMADEVVSVNRTLVERGFAQWIDGY